MSRVRWRSLASRAAFDFAHTTNGRLHADHNAQKVAGWAVCGGETFLRKSILALRAVGVPVAAVSVLPTSFHNCSARLKAQDAQDRIVRDMDVPTGLAFEAIDASEEFANVLLEQVHGTAAEKMVAPPPLRWLESIERSGKTVIRAPTDPSHLHQLIGCEQQQEASM